METQKLITNPISRETSIREQLHQEIEEAPDEILATALDFLVFLKSRYSSPPTSTKVPSTAGSLLKTLERIGKWEGDDFDECLELVHASRGRLYVAIDEEDIEDLETD